jgi:hypothetical protein
MGIGVARRSFIEMKFVHTVSEEDERTKTEHEPTLKNNSDDKSC